MGVCFRFGEIFSFVGLLELCSLGGGCKFHQVVKSDR